MKLEDKTAIVTAASSDRGGAIAELLASEGASVTINYFRNKQKAESVLKRIESNGSKAMVWQADVTSKTSVDKMVQETANKFGPVDILVNNAHGKIKRNLFETTEWDEYCDSRWIIANW